jgi:acetyl esterase/lipase
MKRSYLLLCFALTIGVWGCCECLSKKKGPKIKKLTPVVKETPDGNKYYLYSNVPYLEEGRNEKLDIYIPYKKMPGVAKFPAVLNIHGGGWREGYKSRLITKRCAEAIVEKGYAVICNDYLLNTDERKAWPVNIYDCKTALRYTRKVANLYDIDADNISVLGNSAGGHLALLIGFSADSEELNSGGLYKEYPTDVRCIVNIYGIPDLRNVEWGPKSFVNEGEDEKKVLALASPVAHLSKKSPPVLSVHGVKDELVPFSLSEGLEKIMKSKGLEHEMFAVPEGRHAFTLYPDGVNGQTDLRPRVIKFLDKYSGLGKYR